jgi:hypothetical protein
MISHVAELRCNDLTELQARKVKTALENLVSELGYETSQIEVQFASAEVKIQWGIPALGDNKPSEAQVSFARKLYAELKAVATGEGVVAIRARQLADEVVAEMKSGNVTKQQMSPIIDNMKLAIADVRFEKEGLRVLDQ